MKLLKKLFVKFCAYMVLTMLVMLLSAYVTANWLFDFLGDVFGGSGLGVWLVLVMAGAVSAFFVRKKIWTVSSSSAVVLAVLYPAVTGFTFSPAFLGYSGRTIIQVTAPVLMMFGFSGVYSELKGDENFAVMLGAGTFSALAVKILAATSWAACFMSVIGCMIMIFFSAWNAERAHSAKSEAAALKWAVSVFVGLLMMLAFWVMIWGTWDTTERRYDKMNSL